MNSIFWSESTKNKKWGQNGCTYTPFLRSAVRYVPIPIYQNYPYSSPLPSPEKKVVFWSSNQAWIRVNGMFEYIVNDEIHDIHPFSSYRIYSNIPCTSPCFCTVPKTTIFHAGPPFVHWNERTYLLYGTQYIYTNNPFCTEDRLNNYFAT